MQKLIQHDIGSKIEVVAPVIILLETHEATEQMLQKSTLLSVTDYLKHYLAYMNALKHSLR